MEQEETRSVHWSDEPLGSDKPDTFGRERFVSTVVSRIDLAKMNNPSTVFGVVGEWGSGKSSLLEKIEAGLDDGWLIGAFTPWSSGDSGAMAIEFTATLADLLGEKKSGDLRGQLARYATFVTPLASLVPIFGGAAKGAADNIVEALATPVPWNKQFQELSDTISSIGKRVLIVVDDVDRLGGDELLNLLRIIRLLGRFRGVHYLLAYDQKTVEDLLRSAGLVGRAADYMEKIVQHPFEVPPLPRAAILRWLDSMLDELILRSAARLDEVGQFRRSELLAIIARQIRTPRTLLRFRENLLAFAEHVRSAELDLLDYVAAAWLRLSAHGVWEQIPLWHEELRTGEAKTGLLGRKKITVEDWRQRVFVAGVEAQVDGVIAILSFLFPGISDSGGGYFYEHPRSLSNPKYVGRYLLLDIPEDDVRDKLVEDVTSGLVEGLNTDQSVEIARLIDAGDENIAVLVLEKMIAIRRQEKTTSLEYLRFLSERLTTRPDRDDPRSSITRHLRMLLGREISCAVITGVANAPEIVAMVGEEESLRLVWVARRVPEFHDRAGEIVKCFAEYWNDQLIPRFNHLRDSGLFGFVVELIETASMTSEILDELVADFEGFVSLAMLFVRFEEWVGSETSYDLSFRSQPFISLTSIELRERYSSQVQNEAGQLEYKSRNLPCTSIGDETVRAFAIDSVHALSLHKAEETTSAS